MLTRLERAEDVEKIDSLTTEAFKAMPYSDGSESKIIQGLRSDGDLALSLVVEDKEALIGHVAFSRVTINGVDDNWFGLGPISVYPSRQRTGVGTLLMRDGIEQMTLYGAKGIVLVGDPNYYRKFGFLADGRLSYQGLPSDIVQWLSINGDDAPRGEIEYCRAFAG